MNTIKNKPWLWRIPFLMLLIGLSTWAIRRHQPASGFSAWQSCEGTVFGTIYHATYQCDNNLQSDIEASLHRVDESLSMFNPSSTLSRINRNESLQSDSLLDRVFALAQRVSGATDGAFDVTVAPLVNAWGFGYKTGTLPDSAQVDSLRSLIGWQRIKVEQGRVTKQDTAMVMDFSAIAKGFGCDVVADMFRSRGVQNFMIEIGGEVVVQGLNKSANPWRVGVNKPIEDSTCVNSELQDILYLTDKAMATSGNYRNFYTTSDGRRIAHTIDPHTGYPVQHSILSATVLAPTCAEADAFATSFMVMGLDKMKEVLRNQPQLSVFVIYADGAKNKVYRTIP